MNIVSISSTIHNSNGNAREIISQKSSRALCIIYVLERVSTPEEEDADADTDRGIWPLAHLLQQKYFINTEYYKWNNETYCIVQGTFDMCIPMAFFAELGPCNAMFWSLRMPHKPIFCSIVFVSFVRKEWVLGYCAILDVGSVQGY